MKQAEAAINALGTNALPFLFENLDERVGSGNSYFRCYQAMPRWMQAKFHYPILDDDIKAISLGHIRRIQPLSKPQLQALVDCLSNLENPRVRMIVFDVLNHSHPEILKICRTLLDDKHPGIRLKAAVSLGHSALVSDPAEPRLFTILIAALESKEDRDACVGMEGYVYRQQPPGGTGTLIPGYGVSMESALRERIETALYRLERYLNEEQKARFRRAITNR